MIPSLEELMPPPLPSDQIVNNLSTDSENNNMDETANAESNNEQTVLNSNEDQSTVVKEGIK
jgi:hypothetical protein